MESQRDKTVGTEMDTRDEDKLSLKDNATFTEDSSVKENDSTGPLVCGNDMSSTCSKNVDVDSTKVSDQRRCEPCLFDNMEVEAISFCVNCAEFLCESCARDHRRSKLTRQHKLLSGDHLPESSVVFKSIKKLTSCQDHPDMVSSYQCHDHKAYICTTCVAVNHRKCDNVAHVTTPEADNADTEPDLKERIRLLLEKTVTAREIKEENISTLLLNNEEIKSKRNDFKESIVSYIQNLFESSTNETEVLLNKELADLETDVLTCKLLEKEGNDERELLETTLRHGTPEEISIIFNRILHEAQRIETEIELQTAKPKARLEFSENSSFLDQKAVCFVSLMRENDNSPYSKMVQIQMDKASDVCDDVVNTNDTLPLSDADNSKTNDKNEIGRALMKREIGQQARKIDLDNSNGNNVLCTIKSIIYLNDGRVVAFDEANKSAKLLGTDFSIQMSHNFNTEPVDMCLVSDYIIVVVFKDLRSVVAYRITDDMFAHDGEFTTKLNALSIASYDEKLSTVAILFSDKLAGSEMNSKSDTIEVQIRKYTNGQILQTFSNFESKMSKKLVITNPKRLCVIGTTTKQILIAVENKLHCFDTDGSTLKENWFYKSYRDVDVNGVNDIATDSDGNVYIVCLESQNIHQISSTNFRANRVLTSKLKDSMSLCLDKTGSIIYVGCEEDDYLHVYHFV